MHAPVALREAPTIKAVRSVFDRLGFDDKETVCLIVLGHQYGRCHPENSGYKHPWYVFDPTEYSIYPNGLGYMTAQAGCARTHRETTVPESGKRQFQLQFHRGMEPFMMLPSDMVLSWDKEYKLHVDFYNRDRRAFYKDAGRVWKKLIELGCDSLAEELRPDVKGRQRHR